MKFLALPTQAKIINDSERKYDMGKFLPLANMRKLVDSAKADLKQMRDIDAKLREKIASLSDQRQFTQEHIKRESAKLRADAYDVAKTYLGEERTLEMLESVAAQREHWTVPGFLAAQSSESDTSSDVPTLLKRLIALQSIARIPTSFLSAQAQAAADRSDWPNLGTIYAEAQFRGQQGDEGAARLVNGISTIQVPEISEALQTISEATRLAEWLGYTSRSIASGEDDHGMRHEAYAREWVERQAAKQQA